MCLCEIYAKLYYVASSLIRDTIKVKYPVTGAKSMFYKKK